MWCHALAVLSRAGEIEGDDTIPFRRVETVSGFDPDGIEYDDRFVLG